MRYSKPALLVFGAGLLLGLAIVSVNLTWLGWLASGTMAAGIALLPVALVADWWSYRPWAQPAAKPRKRGTRGQPGSRAKSSPPRKRRST